jgi:hypothetical protein
MVNERKQLELKKENERTNFALRTEALRIVKMGLCSRALDLIARRRKRETTRRTMRRAERRIPSSKHGVKSNSLRVEAGPHRSWRPW